MLRSLSGACLYRAQPARTLVPSVQSALSSQQHVFAARFHTSGRFARLPLTPQPVQSTAKPYLLQPLSSVGLTTSSSSSSSSSPSSSACASSLLSSPLVFPASYARHITSAVTGPIPVVDVSRDKQKAAAEIGRACEEIGFFTITGHGVDKALIDKTWRLLQQYFDQPAAEKHKIPMTEEYPYGYSGFLEENLAKGHAGGGAPDLKECFAIGPSNPAAGMSPRQLPANPKELAAALDNYYEEMVRLSSRLLSLFALALKLPENWFEDKIDRHRSALRALNYPEYSGPIAPGQLRTGVHTDYGSLTILRQDDVGGLQVKNRQNEWQAVPFIQDSFIINIGDLMERWTNDKWRSTPHRVIPTRPRRQSLAFFHNINADHLVTCIDACQGPGNPAKYPPIKAWDHLMQKHLESTKSPY